MNFHLLNVRTGESFPLHPDRTLIGTADHAAIRTDGGPYLAALLVRYPAGWVVHGLSDDPDVTFNRQTLKVTQQVWPQAFDVLAVGDELFRFVPEGGWVPDEDVSQDSPPSCFVYVRDPDGVEECRAVDHDLLFGRLRVCHVWFPDSRLSRLAALVAAHSGQWYVHALAKGPVGRNRKAVTGFAPIKDGDELLIGPLMVRVEIRAATPEDEPHPAHHHEPAEDEAPSSSTAEISEGTLETALPLEREQQPDGSTIRAAAIKLDQWLKAHEPRPSGGGGGLGGWLGAQKQRLARFWYDTPEATSARGLRAAGRTDEAFAVLDRAVRARPDSPELLRELYRLYDAVGLTDLCYRPLRQIEKLAEVRGGTDTWVLEALARVCGRLGRKRPGMSERAIGYWSKLEKATGVSYAKERDAVRAAKTLREGGFTKATDDGTGF
jgi:hypothetical protein